MGVFGVALLVSVIGANTTAVAAPAPCDVQLTVDLTPDVPNPLDPGFLSSLLSNQVSYRLSLWRQLSDSVLVLELTGPGPDYRCGNVIDAIRKDGRVLAVRVGQEPS